MLERRKQEENDERKEKAQHERAYAVSVSDG
jgi:hypothetical protein